MDGRKKAMRNMHIFLRPCRLLSFVSLAAASLLLPLHAAFAQGDDVARDPVPLVRRASQNDLKSANCNHPYRYRLHKIDDNKITTKEVVETKDGDVARLIAMNDKPLE